MKRKNLTLIRVYGASAVLMMGCLSVFPAQQTRSTVIFAIKTNEFWLNLHSFLYVLGQSQGRPPASLREAMRDAPADAERELQTLTPEEREVWAKAVAAYANGLSKKDPIVDKPLAMMINALAAAVEASSLRSVEVDSETRATLEQAAPIYRKAWWPAHRSTNQAYRASLQPLIERHGNTILAFITSKYGLPWPSAGYPVHLAVYSNWAGAFSTDGNLLVVGTNAHAGTQGVSGLETVFHEAMHQWDDSIDEALRRQAQAIGKNVPPQLSHAMIFFTAGEAVRRVVPEHVPVAEASGLWDRGLPFRAVLNDVWKAYLDGRGTRDEALKALVAQTAVSAVGQQQSVSPRLFTFQTDEFWLNLHHFLYVLGRSEAQMPDSREPAVAGAPQDAERGLQGLTPDEQRTWASAVAAYAAGLSLRSNLEEPMSSVTRGLAGAGDRPNVAEASLDPALVAVLEKAAPIYRKAWWPAHRAANRIWRSSAEDLIDRYGRAAIDFVSRAYGMPWPDSGYPVYISSYANFGGAYSIGGANFVIVSSMTDMNKGLNGLEIMVHEGMHQWDGRMFAALASHARPLNLLVPRDLTHAMIFFTAGEAVRRINPMYVPYAEAFDVWPKKLSGASLPAQRLKPLLEEIWKPYLNGHGSRDEALAALVAKAAAESR